VQQKISLKLLPSEAADEAAIKKLLANSSGKKESEIKGFISLSVRLMQEERLFG